MDSSTQEAVTSERGTLEGATSVYFESGRAELGVDIERYKHTPWGRLCSGFMSPSTREPIEPIDHGKAAAVRECLSRAGVAFKTAALSLATQTWDRATSNDPEALDKLNSKFARELERLAHLTQVTDVLAAESVMDYPIDVKSGYGSLPTTQIRCVGSDDLPKVEIDMVDEEDYSKGIRSICCTLTGHLVSIPVTGQISEGYMSGPAFQKWARCVEQKICSPLATSLIRGGGKGAIEERLVSYIGKTQQDYVETDRSSFVSDRPDDYAYTKESTWNDVLGKPSFTICARTETRIA